jgi:HEAT repeat protein
MGGYAVGKNSFYRFSSKAVDSVPDIAQRANSPSINDRIGVLEQLVIKSRGDLLLYNFAYDLPPEDYYAAAVSILEGRLFTLEDPEKVRNVFDRIVYVAIHFKMTALLPEVVVFLDYNEPIVQVQALRILEQLEAKDYTKEIAKAACSPNRDVSWTALQVLVNFKAKEAVPALISYLKEDDFSRQRYAVEALAGIEDRSAIPHLIPLLKTKLISWVLHALVSLDAREALPHIKALYKEGGPNGNCVLLSLAYFGDEQAISDILAEMTDEKMPRGESLLEGLLNIKARAVIPALILALEDEKVIGGKSNRGPNIIHQIMITLAKFQANDAIPVFQCYLKANNYLYTETTIEALGLLKAKQVIPELLRMLDSNEYSKRSAAAMALAQIGELSTIERVIATLKQRPDANPIEVLWELAHVSDPNTYEELSLVKLPRLKSLPIEEYLNQITEKCGVKITLSGNIPLPDEKRHRTVVGQEGHTGLSALKFAFQVLNYSVYKNTIFIDNGVVHVVTIEEAYDLWDIWLTNHKKNKTDQRTTR